MNLRQKKIRLNLTNAAEMLDRNGVSDRVGANIINATLKSVNASTNEKVKFDIVDRNRVRRSRAKTRNNIRVSNIDKLHTFVNESICFGLYFDSKKDKTNVSVINEDKSCPSASSKRRTH